jgi:hypothetical protein
MQSFDCMQATPAKRNPFREDTMNTKMNAKTFSRTLWTPLIAGVVALVLVSDALAAPSPLIWIRTDETSGTSDQNPSGSFTVGTSITNLGTLGGSGYLRERTGIGDPGDNVTIVTSPLPLSAPNSPNGVIDLPAANGSGFIMTDGGFLDPIDGKGTPGLGAPFGPDTKLTVMAQVYYDVMPSSLASILSKSGGATGGSVLEDFSDGYTLALIPGTVSGAHRLHFQWGNTNSPGLSLSSPDISDSALLGKWNHLAAVFDEVAAEAYVTFYLNGQSLGTFTMAGPTDVSIEPNDLPLAVGTYPAGNTQWDGKVGEVRIFDSALSFTDLNSFVPEPNSIVLLSLGGLMLLRRARR